MYISIQLLTLTVAVSDLFIAFTCTMEQFICRHERGRLEQNMGAAVAVPSIKPPMQLLNRHRFFPLSKLAEMTCSHYRIYDMPERV